MVSIWKFAPRTFMYLTKETVLTSQMWYPPPCMLTIDDKVSLTSIGHGLEQRTKYTTDAVS